MRKKVFSLLSVMLVVVMLTSIHVFAEGASCSHQWEDTGASTATCTQAGYQPQTCTLCGSTRNKPVSATGHSWVDNGECTATCGKDGVQPQICSVCSSTRNKPVSATGQHIWVDNGECTATCGKDGVQPQICSVCASTRNKPVAATGHTEEIVKGKTATCTEAGLTEGKKCSVCGETLVAQEEIPALGHTSAEAVRENEVAATCTEAGSYDEVVYCSVCGEEVSREPFEIEATGHTPGEAVEENRVEPTCTEKGSYDSVVYCEVCGEEVSREPFEIDALGHVLVQVAAKAPTCTESGWNAYESCQREGCGYSTYQELPASGHKFGETTVYEPEYNKEGYSVHTCTVCGYEERFNIVPPLPYLAGDVNGDGRLTGADYLILKRAILKIAPLPDKFAAAGDFNGDGEMTATDYLLLKRQILFGE